ncbi:MAG: hydroxyacid dehydrogenase [Spirochaetales bacterium]|jgi:phosphoglycerate dehydrogenase-like enzyme|nr:hydroxyacid dehydrogenase [Spirochaetales bacterium]
MKGGINTKKSDLDNVFTQVTQSALAERLELDFAAVPVQSDLESMKASVSGAEVIISTWGALPYTPDILDVCPELKLVLYGAGSFKSYVTPELVFAGVTVCSAVHLNAQPVAEFTLGIILTSLKNVIEHSRKIHETGRNGWEKPSPYNGGYYRTRVGLLGFGEISRILLKLLGNFEFEVFIADDFMSAEDAAAFGAKKAAVEEIMADCDVVSIHHADVEKNWNIINKRTLAMMKPGARIINTSRGRMINEPDLVEKLREGTISAYLDVTHPEPPKDGHPFYELDNCILTPHVAGSLGTEVHRMGDYCLRELDNWIAGKPLENQIDITALENRA